MVIAFAGVVTFHARGVDSNLSVADHCYSSPDLFLDEQVLINISKKVRFRVCHFKSSLSGQTWESIIMGRIKTIMLEAHVPKILEHVSQ